MKQTPATLAFVSSVISGLLSGPSLAAAALPPVRLGPDLATRLGRDALAVQAAAGAEVGDCPGGIGVVPTQPGAALSASLPDGVSFMPRGTVLFRFAVTRRIGHAQTKPGPVIPFLRLPWLRVDIQEGPDCPKFMFYPHQAATRALAATRIAYLEAETWYHGAVAWDSQTGQVDVFLNGWAQQRSQLPPWTPAELPDPTLELGGRSETNPSAAVAVAAPELLAWPLTEAQLRQHLDGVPLPPANNGFREPEEQALDLDGLSLTPIYEPDFTAPLPVVHEDTLFEGETRVREPEPGNWVLEGPGRAFTEDGELVIDNLATEGVDHVVLWMPPVGPADFLLEFDITVEKPDEGLAILFFAARPHDDPQGSIFKPGMPKRQGTFRNYTHGLVNSYHISYIAAGQLDSSIPGPRRTANVRKDSGFYLTACGTDRVFGCGLGRGPHRIRLLKLGNQIRLEANGAMSVAFTDDGNTYGPVWGDGYIGLRQMNYILSASYSNMKLYAVTRN